MSLGKANRLLTQVAFLNKRIGLLRERTPLSDSGITKEALKALDNAFDEIGTLQQELLERVNNIAVIEKTAEEEEARYRDIFELAPDGYLVTDRHGKIKEANEASAELFNIPKQSLIGHSLTEFIDQQSTPSTLLRHRTSHSTKPERIGLRILRFDRTFVDVVARVRAVPKRGELLWLICEMPNPRDSTAITRCPDLFIGTSAAMLAIKKQLEAVIPFPTVTVLLEGETGTGKEVFAEALHRATFGTKAPFVPINCPAIPDHLLESELFGYEKGAFTDAASKKRGWFELAHGGTLFLDEISSLSANLQPKLLRVLETKTFTRLGGLEKIDINCRITGATNKPLRELVDAGKFREDLYHRLSTFTISIPPLRDRIEDIPRLTRLLIEQAAMALRTDVRGITPEALAAFEAYHWPGNVRELRKVIERAVILTPPTESINTKVLPKEVIMGHCEELTPVVALRNLEKQHLRKILAACGGNKSHAARLLGISRTTLRKKLKD